jgi:hypothetical protein
MLDKQVPTFNLPVQDQCQAHSTSLAPAPRKTPSSCQATPLPQIAHKPTTHTQATAASAIGYAGVCLVLSNRPDTLLFWHQANPPCVS